MDAFTTTITLRGIDHSDTLENEVRKRIDTLARYYGAITSCHVVVERAQRHHERGNRFHVRIDLTVPGDEIAVAHEGSLHATAKDLQYDKNVPRTEPGPEHQHAFVAIREAFDAMRRRLQDYARRQRGDVKTSSPATSDVAVQRRRL